MGRRFTADNGNIVEENTLFRTLVIICGIACILGTIGVVVAVCMPIEKLLHMSGAVFVLGLGGMMVIRVIISCMGIDCLWE
jgi:energy-converting hydrogenase Eha subunit C